MSEFREQCLVDWPYRKNPVAKIGGGPKSRAPDQRRSEGRLWKWRRHEES
ncbi:MAG: hypothetical protein Q8S33_21720 [Myxococcales bacterium]|nr:hypothetical protein [Myxococcales bacterium]MDP3502966.1 hypothetical protein [Myxococcales bacterium]